MPLKDGCDRETIRANIVEMKRKGHSQEQAVAAALSHAERQGCTAQQRK